MSRRTAISERSRRPSAAACRRTFIRNTVCEVNRTRRRLKGILFGSCKFGDATTLIEVLRPSKIRGETAPNRMVWAGGYDQEIEYTRSSLFDIYFYDLLLRTNGRNEIGRVEKTLDHLNKTLPGLAESLSLCIVARISNKHYRDLIKGEDIYD